MQWEINKESRVKRRKKSRSKKKRKESQESSMVEALTKTCLKSLKEKKQINSGSIQLLILVNVMTKIMAQVGWLQVKYRLTQQ